MSVMRDTLAQLADGARLDVETAEAAFNALMDGEADPAQTAAFLMALRVRGETLQEIVAGAGVLRARAVALEAPGDVVDTCGTGGDASGTINISTAAALVAAGAGVTIAKHGNRSVSSKSGSSDVLDALGVNIAADPTTVRACIEAAGVGFLFAPAHHAAMRHVAPARQSLGLRTIFNLIGPLTNPAGARRQVLGVFDRAWLRPMAEALHVLGAERALVVHGADGLDEITVTDVTHAAELDRGAITEVTLDAAQWGLARAPLTALRGGDAATNAEAIRAVLAGAPGPQRDVIVANAAGALWVAGAVDTVADGVPRAEHAIDSGAAARALDTLIAVSHGRAP